MTAWLGTTILPLLPLMTEEDPHVPVRWRYVTREDERRAFYKPMAVRENIRGSLLSCFRATAVDSAIEEEDPWDRRDGRCMQRGVSLAIPQHPD